MATLSERFITSLGDMTWRPRHVEGATRLLVPDSPVDLDRLASSLIDATDAPLGEDDEPLVDVEDLDVAELLRSEGLPDEQPLLELDWPEGNYSLLLLPASKSRGYITIPGEWEGGTWPWSALAAAEPANDSRMLTAFICDFIDSRGESFHFSECFPGWIANEMTVAISPLVDVSRVETSIERWSGAARK